MGIYLRTVSNVWRKRVQMELARDERAFMSWWSIRTNFGTLMFPRNLLRILVLRDGVLERGRGQKPDVDL